MVIIEIAEELPPTLNDIIEAARTNWRVSNRIKRYWTKKIELAAKELDKFPTKTPVWCEFHWFLKNFARDADNVASASKFIFDGMVKAKTISSDNLIIIQSPVIHYYHRSTTKTDNFLIRVSDSPEMLLSSLRILTYQVEKFREDEKAGIDRTCTKRNRKKTTKK